MKRKIICEIEAANGDKLIVMEGNSGRKKGSGGRPKKAVKRDQLLGVKCTLLERTAIEQKAKSFALTVSDFLRTVALSNAGDPLPKKVLPREVLQLTGMFNHTAANINQLARRHNSGDAISLSDRERLLILEAEVKQVVQTIKLVLL